VASSPFLFPVPFTRVASSPVFFALAVAVPPMGWGFGAVPTRSGHPCSTEGERGTAAKSGSSPTVCAFGLGLALGLLLLSVAQLVEHVTVDALLSRTILPTTGRLAQWKTARFAYGRSRVRTPQ
jgi:hypothetical protein